MKVQIGHSIFSFSKEEFKGHEFYALKKVAFQPDRDGQKQKAKVQVVSVRPGDLEDFKAFLRQIING